MVNIRSPRPKSSPEEITAAFKRAAKAIRGSSEKMDRKTIADRAARYVPESSSKLLVLLRAMDDDAFKALLGTDPTVGEECSHVSSDETRPLHVGDWNRYRRRTF